MRITEKPDASMRSCTAWEMSPTRFPGRACSTASKSEASVAASIRAVSGSISPTAKVQAPSATQPSSVTPMSTEMMSPSASSTSPGIPWTTSELGEAQIEPGKPR